MIDDESGQREVIATGSTPLSGTNRLTELEAGYYTLRGLITYLDNQIPPREITVTNDSNQTHPLPLVKTTMVTWMDRTRSGLSGAGAPPWF